jgi:hypothetical protein
MLQAYSGTQVPMSEFTGRGVAMMAIEGVDCWGALMRKVWVLEKLWDLLCTRGPKEYLPLSFLLSLSPLSFSFPYSRLQKADVWDGQKSFGFSI